MDEVELFNRALSGSEIAAIKNASGSGKCRVSCQLPRIASICPTASSTTASFTICNYSTEPKQVTWDLATLGTPMTFTPSNSSGPITIPPSTPGVPGCVTIAFQIDKPPGLPPQQFEPYRLQVSDVGGAICESAGFALIVDGPLCPTPRDMLDVPGTLSFSVFNSHPVEETFQFRLTTSTSDDDTTARLLSLNGLPPGQPVTGSIAIAANSSANVTANASFVRHDPFRMYGVDLEVFDPGAATYSPLTTARLLSPEPPANNFLDCNENGQADDVDISTGVSHDLNGDGAPDECMVCGNLGVDGPGSRPGELTAAPNPFSSEVCLSALGDAVDSRLAIYDVRGRRVRAVAMGGAEATRWCWDGRNDEGRPVAPGLYFVELDRRDTRMFRKVIRLR